MHDWLIKGALLFDGLGSPPVEADLSMAGGLISGIGKDLGAARQNMDARGLFLSPGLIDLHAHYDAQALWDPSLSPSCSLGVTTVLAGNCGFGIAPNKVQHRDVLLKNLSVAEGMDLDALRQGVSWSFESFEEYLAALRKAKPWLNMAVFAQHSTIRIAVMGEDAALRSATEKEIELMRWEVARALRAGAIGFASSFAPNHGGWERSPMPSSVADVAELRALIEVLGQEQRGVFMMANGSPVTSEDLAAFHQLNGTQLKLMCDAGFGLHFLGHWVRDRQAMNWSEGIAKLTSEPARRYRIANRGRLEVGCWADVMLFDPIQVGISAEKRVCDLPPEKGHKPASRLIRRPNGLAGVWVNGTRVFDGQSALGGIIGPGQVLDQFQWGIQGVE